MKIRLAAPLQTDSIVDGEGIRMVLWVQGCKHNCKGCHNPETHSFSNGFEIEIEELKKQIIEQKNQDGITLSGGDPLYQIYAVLEIAKFCKENNLNIWCYTGFIFEELIEMMNTNKKLEELLQNIDVLVDGKFEIEKRSLNLHFRGSSNQRVLDMKKSLKQLKPIEIEKYKFSKEYKGYSNQDNIDKGIFI